MRKTTQAALLTLSSAVVGLSAWQWGLGGLGISLTAVSAAALAWLGKRPADVHGDLPGTTAPQDLPGAARQTDLPTTVTQPLTTSSDGPHSETPTLSMTAHVELALARSLAEAAQRAPSLASALQAVGERLCQHLGARAWICLRVEGWNGESGLLRPWTESGQDSNDLIDLGAMATVHQSTVALGEALSTLKPSGALLQGRKDEAWPWRARGTQRVLAVPVSIDGWPLALLEFDDPSPERPAHSPLLDIAAMQLGFVAQRDVNQAHMANSAEHLSRLTMVASRISNGVAITDRDGTIEWVNDAFMALTGWSEGLAVGRKLTDLLANDVGDTDAESELAQHIASGEPFRFSYESSRHAERSITRYWGEIDAFQVLDESGGRNRYVCFFNDVTKRKAQEHIREQEREFLEALLGNLPVSLFVLDPVNLNVVAINRYTEIEFQLQRELVVGRTLEAALGKSVLRRVNPFMQRAIESGETVEHDFTWHAGGQDERVVNARHFALRHANGRPRLLISLVRDITAARQAQADLEESERRFRELVESMDDSVYVATERRQELLYLSPRTETLLGLPADVLMHEPQVIRRHVVAEDLRLLDEQENQEAEGQATDMLLRVQVPQRGQRWLRHRTRSRRLPDGQLRVYGLVSDVTDEHMQALELQRARDLAEAASQAKSQFMANMSHEIRTPMNGILGMTELLLGTPLNDKQRRFAQAVYRSGESLLEIINDILDFAKIEAGRLELANSDFVLRTLVEDTLELMAPRAHEKGLELSFREQPGLPSVIHGDPLRLRQILTNLVANAIKFTEHGEVVVDIRRALSKPDGTDPRLLDLEFMVRDTGIGITAEVIPRLFSAFVQANGGMARRYGGTGLGLAISKQLVELMGGQIEAHSAPGVGSEFVFRVPVRVGDTQADMALVDEPGMPSLNVLVVDDNETNRTVIENMLTAWGMTVRQARHGKEALQVLQDEHGTGGTTFDLALVDMNMPELDGLGLAEAIHDDPRFTQLKMILLSSVSSPDDVRRAQEAGFLRFVAKPLRKAELRQAILGVSAEIGTDLGTEGMLIQKNVLVIEDNPVNQEVCSQMLRRLGCEVRVASSALEGLRRLGEVRFDLVLMDIQMPGMDGVEALGWFRRGSNNRFNFITPPDTPVVAVTANALEGDEQRFLNLGFNGYLSKPFRQSQLQKVLVEHTHVVWPPARPEETPAPEAAQAQTDSPTPPASPQPSQPPRPSAADGPALAMAPAALSLVVDRAGTLPSGDTTTAAPTPAPSVADGSPASAAPPVLDPDALQRLRDLDPKGNNQLMERVARAFDTSLSRLLPQLEEAAKLQDQSAIMHVAHTLKSSSASIGALKLSHMCAEIEAMIRRQSGEDLTSRIQDVPLEAERVKSALRHLLEPEA